MAGKSDYYCEYYYSFGEWQLIGRNHPPDYYCPVPPMDETYGREGQVVVKDPIPEKYRGQLVEAQPDPEFPDQEYYVEYEYHDGQFFVKSANCPEGFVSAGDPLEFAKRFGKIRVFPVRIPRPPARPNAGETGSGDELA
jgi:hypothetical protein